MLKSKDKDVIALHEQLMACENAFAAYKNATGLKDLKKFFEKVREKLETSPRSILLEGCYMTPKGTVDVTVHRSMLGSILQAIDTVLSDSRNRKNTYINEFDLVWLGLQMLDKVDGFAAKSVMKALAIITEPDTVALSVYETIAFYAQVIMVGLDAEATSYDRREGNTWWPPQNLEKTVAKTLGMNDDDAIKFVEEQHKTYGTIVPLDGGWAPKCVVDAIGNVKKMLSDRHCQAVTFNKDCILQESQIAAIQGCLNEPFGMITAPGGTGKTTTLAYTAKALIDRGLSVLIVAPTGVACDTLKKDIQDLIGRNYVERLEVGDVRTLDYIRCSPTAPKSVDVMFVDEASMMDYCQLASLPKATHLVLVGDVWQLPPIGVGFPLDDLRRTLQHRNFTLTENMRAKENPVLVERLAMVRDNRRLYFKEVHSGSYKGTELYGLRYIPTAKSVEDVRKIHAEYSCRTHYMLDKLVIAHCYDAAVTCLRKDVIARVNTWELLARSYGIESYTDALQHADLVEIADEIQTRSVVSKKLATETFGEPVASYLFEKGDKVVWTASRQDTFTEGHKRISVYSGFRGDVVGAENGAFVVDFGITKLTVGGTECNEKDSPILLQSARNIHKLQSVGVKYIMYIISGARTLKDENGKWHSVVNLPEAYTSVSRARSAYWVANPYGGKICCSQQGSLMSVELAEPPMKNSAADHLLSDI